MLIIWKANFSGNREELAHVSEKLREMGTKHGEEVDGPYYGQDADLFWLFWTRSGNLGESGREFLPWPAKSGTALEPVR